MEWFFDGIGTFIVGLLVGGGAGSVVTWRIALWKNRLTQKAGDHATQMQIGRDQVNRGTSNGL